MVTPLERWVEERGGWECAACGGRSNLAVGGMVVHGLRGRKVECAECHGRAMARRLLTPLAILFLLTGVVLPALALVIAARTGASFRSVADLWAAGAFGWLPAILPFLAVLAVVVVVHELGHALAARLTGWRLVAISVGAGPSLVRTRAGRVGVEVKALPLGGATLAAPRRAQGYRWKALCVFAAGVVAELLLAAGVLATGAEQLGLRGDLLWVVTITVVTNLLPFEVATPWGPGRTDGKQILELRNVSEQQVRRQVALGFAAMAHVALQHGDADGALRDLERACSRFPDDPGLRAMLAVALLVRGDAAPARELLVALVDDPSASPAERAMRQNNLAWADLLLDDPALLAEALEHSADSFAALGWSPPVQSTRGFALVRAGEVEEGNELVGRALRRVRNRRERANVLCVSALAAAAQGRPDVARTDAEMARAFDPRCPLLGRAFGAVRGLVAPGLP